MIIKAEQQATRNFITQSGMPQNNITAHPSPLLSSTPNHFKLMNPSLECNVIQKPPLNSLRYQILPNILAKARPQTQVNNQATSSEKPINLKLNLPNLNNSDQASNSLQNKQQDVSFKSKNIQQSPGIKFMSVNQTGQISANNNNQQVSHTQQHNVVHAPLTKRPPRPLQPCNTGL